MGRHSEALLFSIFICMYLSLKRMSASKLNSILFVMQAAECSSCLTLRDSPKRPSQKAHGSNSCDSSIYANRTLGAQTGVRGLMHLKFVLNDSHFMRLCLATTKYQADVACVIPDQPFLKSLPKLAAHGKLVVAAFPPPAQQINRERQNGPKEGIEHYFCPYWTEWPVSSLQC